MAKGEPEGGAATDLIRRAMAIGLSGFFTTEEALRKALGDNVPQDWIDFATAQSEQTRRQFAEAVANEMGRVLENADLGEMMASLLETRSIEVRARIRLLPREEGGASLEDVHIELEEDDLP